MKKVRVHVSKGYLFSIFVFSLGLFLFIFGNVAYYREKNAVDLSELSVENCQKGTYVKGYIDSYVVKTTKGMINESLFGSNCSWISPSGAIYEVYTIPMKNNMFIQFMTKNKTTIQALEAYIDEHRMSKYVEGVIVESYFPINSDWYRENCSFQGKKLQYHQLEEIVSTSLTIVETNFHERKYNIYIGMILIVTSVGCFMLAGGLREFFHEVKQEFKEAFHKR